MVHRIVKRLSTKRRAIMASLGKKEVLRISKEGDVTFVRPWFPDILSFLKSFAITVRELKGALEESIRS